MANDRPPRIRRRRRLTRQTRTASLAAAVLVATGTVTALVPVPFVTWAPGTSIDLLADRDGKPSIEVSGAETYPARGSLLLLTVAQSSSSAGVTLPEALIDYWSTDHDVLPREAIYPGGTSAREQESHDVQQMNTSQQDAIVAALRAAGKTVTALPIVTQVTNSGPSNGRLQPGDFVTKVDDVRTLTPDEVYGELQKKPIGSRVSIEYLRGGIPGDTTIEVVGSNQDKKIPVIGARFEVGYAHQEQVVFNIDPNVVGSSGGLMFALTIYDRLTEHDLPAGRVIAGTGKLDANGNVDSIGGVPEKLAAAEASDASVFLLPARNCGDLAGTKHHIRIVKVSTLAEAITSLHALEDPATANQVPTC